MFEKVLLLSVLLLTEYRLILKSVHNLVIGTNNLNYTLNVKRPVL